MARDKVEQLDISIRDFLGGFCPDYFRSSYPTYGSKGMASGMRNVDLSVAHFIRQGPGHATLTNGNQAGEVTALVKKVMQVATSTDESFAGGGALIHKIRDGQVVSDGTFSYTIDKGAVTGEDLEDLEFFGGYLFYSYNYTGGADVGRMTFNPHTFDDDWGSTVPAVGAAVLTAGVPHPMESGSENILYIGNGRYVATYDIENDVFDATAVDLPVGCVVQDIKLSLSSNLIITVNWPNLTGNNAIKQPIYIWDTVNETWSQEVPRVGRAGGMFKRDGMIWIFYEDVTRLGEGRLGYLDGFQLKEMTQFDGTLPKFYQISQWRGFISWISDGYVFAWGSGGEALRTPARLFQFMQGKYTTTSGGIGAPFGKMMIGSSDGGTNYDISQEYGFETDSYWHGMTFDISGAYRNGAIDKIAIKYEKPTSATAGVKFNLVDSQGNTAFTTTLGSTITETKKREMTKRHAEDIRPELDFSVGSATFSFDIKAIFISTHPFD